MTIAICTVCGEYKFGAFVPCKGCGTAPKTVSEKARSLFLSDRDFPIAELRKFSQLIKSGDPVPYDPVALAMTSDGISADEYYWEHISDDGEHLACMKCGRPFITDRDVLCPSCTAEAQQKVLFCPSCVVIYDQGIRFCRVCGSAVSARENAKSLAFLLMLGMERMTNPSGLAQKFSLWARTLNDLPEAETARGIEETRWLSIFVASIVVRGNTGDPNSAGAKILAEMLSLYWKSLAFRQIEPKVAIYWSSRCLARTEEYTRALSDFVRNPRNSAEMWMVALAEAAEENCYRVAEGGAAVMEMISIIGYFGKSFHEILRSTFA